MNPKTQPKIYRIETTSASDLIDEETSIVSRLYGVRGRDWKRKRQILMEVNDVESERRIQVDAFHIELQSGEMVEVWFDLTSVYGPLKN